MNTFQKICMMLLIIGGINWGLIGILQFDLVGYLFGGQAAFISRIVFALVGICALISISSLFVPQTDQCLETGKVD